MGGLVFYGPSRASARFLFNAAHQAIYALGKHNFSCEGVAHLPEAIAQTLPIRHEKVDTVQRCGARWVVTTTASEETFDRIVIACPDGQHFFTGTPRQQELLESIEYSSTITAAIEVDSAAIQQFAMLFIAEKENNKISLITNEGRKESQHGRAVMGVALHGAFAQTIIGEPDQTIFSAMWNEAVTVLPALKQNKHVPKFLTLQRWQRAIPVYSPKSVAVVREFWQKGQGEHGVYFCGDYMNHPFVEGAMLSGLKVAKLLA